MPVIDHTQPLRLGFAFSHAADKVDELVQAYRDAGIPAEDIDTIDAGTLAEWQANGWDISVYARGSEMQFRQIDARGFRCETAHLLGPFKPSGA